MKTVIKSHMVTIGAIAGIAILIIIFGLILSGTLYLVIGRKSNLNRELSVVSNGGE